MYKNHLDLHDIRIGDWVQEYSEITGNFSMPMYVSAIFADGTIYLDFNGNKGDIWEANIEDIAPIRMDKESLKGFGFELDFDIGGLKLSIGDNHIYIRKFQYYFNKNNWAVQIGEDVRFFNKWFVQIGEDVRLTPVCSYIHELQHAYYKYAHNPLILNWKGI